MTTESKTVNVQHFVAFHHEYEAEGWKVQGYSEYDKSGYPAFVELYREVKTEVNQ